jgi:hypothetical protein
MEGTMKKAVTGLAVVAALCALAACGNQPPQNAMSPYSTPVKAAAVPAPAPTNANSFNSNGYYGYSATPGSASVPYGSHGWPNSPFNGGNGPGTPGVGSGG